MLSVITLADLGSNVGALTSRYSKRFVAGNNQPRRNQIKNTVQHSIRAKPLELCLLVRGEILGVDVWWVG